MTLILGISGSLGWFPMNWEMTWGSLLTARLGTPTWVLGLGIHLLLSGLIAPIYLAGFRAARTQGLLPGLAFSFLHWILLGGFVLGLLPYFHPLIPGALPTPGYLATRLGAPAFWTLLSAHLAFGAVVASLDRPISNARMLPLIDAA